MLNGDFNPKSVIMSKNTNTKEKKIQILDNIIRDGLSQKTISRYCPFSVPVVYFCVQIALASFVAISGPKKVSIFRAHPF
jgi:hypothetical protein